MGNTGTAKVWGYQANFVNPANLAMPSRTSWTIGLFGGFSPNLGGDLANIALYNELLHRWWRVDCRAEYGSCHAMVWLR